jgi:hypothetical protein
VLLISALMLRCSAWRDASRSRLSGPYDLSLTLKHYTAGLVDAEVDDALVT